MSKINDYNTALLPQEVIDLLDDIKNLLNFGKYQWAVVTATPTWTGRQGEHVWVVNATSRILYACAVDQSASAWVVVAGS